jgi:hypothetical protein
MTYLGHSLSQSENENLLGRRATCQQHKMVDDKKPDYKLSQKQIRRAFPGCSGPKQFRLFSETLAGDSNSSRITI